MIILILTIILGIILIDFAIIGFLPKILKIWPSLSTLDIRHLLVEDPLIFPYIKTNIKGPLYDEQKFFWNRKRVSYKSLILTRKYLIVKNTRLTSLTSYNVDSIQSYTIKKKIRGDEVTIVFVIDRENKYFKFRTHLADEWIQAFKKICLFNNIRDAI